MADTNATEATATKIGTVETQTISISGNIGGQIGGTLFDPIYDEDDFLYFDVADNGTYKITATNLTNTQKVGYIFRDNQNQYDAQLLQDISGNLNSFSRSASTDVQASVGTKYYVWMYRSSGESQNYSVSISPVNYSPDNILVYGLASKYQNGTTVSLGTVYAQDKDDWSDLDLIDFWLTDSNGIRLELPNATTFTQWSGGATWGQTEYSFWPIQI